MAEEQQTLVIVKPDAVQRGLTGIVLGRLEQRGLRIVALKLIQFDRGLAERHYAVHREKAFFDELVSFITSGPVAVAVFSGPDAIEATRTTMGATNPVKADPGSLRGQYALAIRQNLIHGSDSPETARYEIDLFFNPDEIVTYQRDIDRWITE